MMPNYLVPLLFLLISPAQAPQNPVGKPVTYAPSRVWCTKPILASPCERLPWRCGRKELVNGTVSLQIAWGALKSGTSILGNIS